MQLQARDARLVLHLCGICFFVGSQSGKLPAGCPLLPQARFSSHSDRVTSRGCEMDLRPCCGCDTAYPRKPSLMRTLSLRPVAVRPSLPLSPACGTREKTARPSSIGGSPTRKPGEPFVPFRFRTRRPSDPASLSCGLFDTSDLSLLLSLFVP